MPEKAFSVCIKDSVFIDPACGSSGMFIQSGDFLNAAGMNANNTMTFYGQEKVKYNAQLCLMKMQFMDLQVLLYKQLRCVNAAIAIADFILSVAQ